MDIDPDGDPRGFAALPMGVGRPVPWAMALCLCSEEVPMMKPKQLPEFKTYQERDAWFLQNADYFTVIKKEGVGHVARDEVKTLADAEILARIRQAIGGGNYMIYAVVGEQSAFVKAVPLKGPVFIKRVP